MAKDLQPHTTSIRDIFQSLRNRKTYLELTKTRIIKIVLGNSVIRVFEKETKKDLIKVLSKIPISGAVVITSQEQYDKWHLKQVNRINNVLKKRQVNIDRLSEEGLKWGHSTKIFNLFIGHLIFYSPYFKKSGIKKVIYFLHVPLDKKVFDALKDCSISNVPSSIKSLTGSKYMELQKLIRAEAGRSIPLHFDEYAWAYDKND